MNTLWLICWLALAFTAAAKQQVVLVGSDDDGEPRPLFTPAHVQLETGDHLTFSFLTSGSNHSVVQSSRDAPCAPIEGGFNSGSIAGDGVDGTTFALNINDTQTPIFFYCAQIDAGSTIPHCARGMWGSVNADEGALETYSAAITSITTLPNQTPMHTPPSEPPSSTTKSSSIPSTPRAPPTRPPSDRHSSSDDDSDDGGGLGTGVIIGIALSSVSCVAAAAAFLVYRRRQRRRAGVLYEGIESSPPVYLSVEMQSDPGSSAGSRLTAVYEQVGGLTVMRAPSVHSQAPTYRTTLSSDPFADNNPFASPEDLETATLRSTSPEGDGDVPPEYASSHSIPPSFHSHNYRDS